MFQKKSVCLRMASSVVFAATGIAITLFAVACSSVNTGSPTNPATTPQSTVQVKIGDSPADRVLSFEVTVGPASMTPDSGAAVTVLSGPQRVELTHLSGTSVPLSMLNIPQGSYKSASITVADPEITFINSSGQVQKIAPAFNQVVTLNFSPSVAISSTSLVVDIDVNLAKSLTFDSKGNITGVNFSANSFTFKASDVAETSKQSDDNGELEDTTGTITAVNGTSFTLTVSQTGAALVFTTDSNTEFEDGASLAVNKIVTVEGTTKADGTLHARKIEGIEDESGAEAEGLITTVTGSPASSLTIVTDQAAGSGTNVVGNTLAADVSKAKFVVKTGDIDTSGIGGLPSSPEFPFDASTIHAGQRVELESNESSSGSGLAAEKVRLQQQALVGTVSGLTGTTTAGPATFTLTAASDSAFATLAGVTQVTVFWQPGTDLKDLTGVSNGDTVRVRGLLFYTGTGFNLIERRITK